MRVVRSVSGIKKFKRAVVALGIFDGMHCAHRRILKAVVEQAKKINGTSVVVTFWPHPQKEHSLYSLQHRLRLMSEVGIDICVVIRFTPSFSRLKAEDFVKTILVERLGAQYVFVGKNFKFGYRAEGDSSLLAQLSGMHHFTLKTFPVMKTHRIPVSSTLIRRLIRRGDLKTAQALLGKPVSVYGTVTGGDAFGRRYGFPTANIDPHHEIVPPRGVYAVKVLLGTSVFSGACYVGPKPSFTRNNRSIQGRRRIKRKDTIEVHIFGFNQDIYGKNIEVQFLKKIREPEVFASSAQLVRRIKKDLSSIRRIFSLH